MIIIRLVGAFQLLLQMLTLGNAAAEVACNLMLLILLSKKDCWLVAAADADAAAAAAGSKPKSNFF